MRKNTLIAGAVLCLLAASRTTSAEEPKGFLPFLGPRLEASRIAPANGDFAWVGWIGANVDIFEKGKWGAYFRPNVETVLGHRVRSFEAVQANYSLEVGLRRITGRGRVEPFFHHVSRHVQDRDKRQAVDWNFLGVRYESAWPDRWKRGGAFGLSAAVATLSSGVAYDWEARAQADIDVHRKGAHAAFLSGDVRVVGAAASPGFARGTFVDARAEAGYRRWNDEKTQFSLFVAYERRNDALIQSERVIDRAVFGFRMMSSRRSSVSTPPLP